MYIIYLCTQLGNEFLVTFYTPRNSSASVSLVRALSSFAGTAESVHSSSLVRLKVLVVSKGMDSAVFAISWTAQKDKAYQGAHYFLTLKAPITTAADGIYKYFFIVFQRK